MNEIVITIEKIDWQSLNTAYGNANKISGYLKDLVLEDENIQLEVCHKLWCALCHQHAYVSSASEVAFPILISIFSKVSELVQIEMMDIFLGFTICTAPPHPDAMGDFQKRLRLLIIEQTEWFNTLSQHSNEEIASFSEGVLEYL